jgi:hypothetical protein
MMMDEENFFGYCFVCYDGKKVLQQKDNMKIIFERTELLYYLVHGHPEFKKEELDIKNGFVWVDISYYYISGEQLVKWFRALLGHGAVSDMINEWGFHLGGSNYLESQLEKLKKIGPISIIKSPIDDINNHYFWKQDIVVTASQESIRAMIQERETDGYILITNLSQNTTYPFNLTFRKPKVED